MPPNPAANGSPYGTSPSAAAWTGVTPPTLTAPSPGRPPPGPYFPLPPPAPRPRKRWSTATIVIVVVVAVVVATVIPGVVLFYLVSGLSTQGASTLYVLGMTVTTTTGPTGTPASYYVNLSLAPTQGLQTGLFGLEVVNSSDVLEPTVAGSSGCVNGATSPTASCVAPGAGWYAVLVGSSGAVSATYSKEGSGAAWTNLPTGSSVVTVTGADRLIVVSSVKYASTEYTLEAFGLSSTPVAGSTAL